MLAANAGGYKIMYQCADYFLLQELLKGISLQGANNKGLLSLIIEMEYSIIQRLVVDVLL